jgi:hypothetical protein
VTDEATVRVEGLDRLVSTMRKAGADLSDLKEAHAAAGRIVAGDAQARAPRSSGALANSVRASRQAKRAQVVAGGARVPYAGPVHWGWPARGIAARPFISQAAQATESRWVPVYLRDVKAAVDKVRGA